MTKKKRAKKKSTSQKKRRNKPLHIPLPFEQIVDAMLQTPPQKAKNPGGS